MPPRSVLIRDKKRIFDDFFKIDELKLSHTRRDGTMSPEQRVLVFERGDAVAILLLNTDKMEVVVVDQFRAPTLSKIRTGGKQGEQDTTGWLEELPAGMVRATESREAAIIRETREETGYVIKDPKQITWFYSSPGGSSERIFLYFAEVTNADRVKEGEDIAVQGIGTEALFDRLRNGDIQDPKLLIAANWLKDRLHHAAQTKPEPLEPSTVRFRVGGEGGPIIGYKTGDVRAVQNVDLWVNSENTDMMMDRVIGKSVSANIRFGGAEKGPNNRLIVDTIDTALKKKVGRSHVRVGDIFETEPGQLSLNNGVRRIVHIATVESPGPNKGVSARLEMVSPCTEAVLDYSHGRNKGFKIIGKRFTSILLPLFGAGDGGLKPDDVVPIMVKETLGFFKRNPSTALREVYLLAFTSREKAMCDRVLLARENLTRVD